MQSNVHDHVLSPSPKNQDERFNVAGACVRRLGIKFPALVDGFDNRVETAYTGLRDRLYLIAPGGRVLFKSKPGPFGFDPKLLAEALKNAGILGDQNALNVERVERGK